MPIHQLLLILGLSFDKGVRNGTLPLTLKYYRSFSIGFLMIGIFIQFMFVDISNYITNSIAYILLSRLEYRGYDSAGVGIDGAQGSNEISVGNIQIIS